MRIHVRPYRGGPRWEYDIRITRPGQSPLRERKLSPVPSESGTRRWAEARAQQLLAEAMQPAVPERKPAPILEVFAPRWVDGYARAEKRQKASEIESKESIIRTHLVPWRGQTPIDALTAEDVLELKAGLADRSLKTTANVMAVLGRMLASAVEWGVIERLPCPIHCARPPRREDHPFYDFEDFERMVSACADPRARLIVLLGAEAGLRMGEIRELRWPDINWRRNLITVARAVWRIDQVGLPKGGRIRRVPMTRRLSAALRAHRHLNPLVVCHPDGSRLSVQTTRSLVSAACRRANVEDCGIHTLRHTFCSHLAMRGALPREIQELAGHKHIETTMIYMHHSPNGPASAIRLLEGAVRGEIRETAQESEAN